MARTYQWRRFNNALTFGATGVSADNVMTLFPGETLVRAVVSLDYWIDSTVAEYLDAGTVSAWGLSLGTSSVSATITPLNDWATTTDRWFYLDQMIFNVINQQVVAGSVSYIARNDEHGRWTDTRNQQRNDTGSDLFLWLTTAVPTPIYSNATLAGSFGVHGLVLQP